MAQIVFTVHGTPLPQGSTVATSRGKVRHHGHAKLTAWRQAIGWAARTAMTTQPLSGPVIVSLVFQFEGDSKRPMTKRPDVDKLGRAVLDALTGIVWRDDCQVVGLQSVKGYGHDSRVEVMVEEMEG